MELESLIKQLKEFSDAENEHQLSVLDELVQNMQSGALDSRIYNSFFQLFERFPESDGFGVFWSIIHFIEACDGYEPWLIESVLRKPCELNLTMINRLLNAGVTKIDNIDLLAILEMVTKSSEVSVSSLKVATRFWVYQQKKGLNA